MTPITVMAAASGAKLRLPLSAMGVMKLSMSTLRNSDPATPTSALTTMQKKTSTMRVL